MNCVISLPMVTYHRSDADYELPSQTDTGTSTIPVLIVLIHRRISADSSVLKLCGVYSIFI